MRYLRPARPRAASTVSPSAAEIRTPSGRTVTSAIRTYLRSCDDVSCEDVDGPEAVELGGDDGATGDRDRRGQPAGQHDTSLPQVVAPGGESVHQPCDGGGR